MTEAEQRLVDVAILMAQELQEYVDVGIECSGSNEAELATQELLKDWEEAYAACGFVEGDHFLPEQAAAKRIARTTAEILDEALNTGDGVYRP